jgi:XTP/dITP diphosphohydrolase/ATP diphosphatase
MPAPRTEALAEAIAIMARLRAPDGCPWDRAQTFDTIKRHTLEETYEVFDAIDRRAWPDLKDELGDLLLQVLFYAQMADEAGYFTLEDVAANLNAKLIRRHPHIFADAVAHTPDDVKQTWEAIKQQEKAGREATGRQPTTRRLLDDVQRHQPAMLEAAKLGKRAASVGFDWPDANGLIAKLTEETAEIEEELNREPRRREALEAELGDLLFTAVNLARHLELEPEFALRAANAKFRSRFNAMEGAAGGAEVLRSLNAEELDQRWREAKIATERDELR